MITAQDIREKAFDRAVRGYDMEAVDEFLDELAADYTTLTKENASLKSKMRVLVEKIEEYRQTEDSMRLALLSAQKMSAQIEGEAKAKAEKLVSEAQTKADNLAEEAKAGIANEAAKLAEARKATQKYVDHMTAVCRKQIEFYEKLVEAQLVTSPKAKAEAEEKAVAEEETVRSIESSAAKAALREPEEEIRLDGLMEDDEDDATRPFKAEPKKKRSRAEFIFEDED